MAICPNKISCDNLPLSLHPGNHSSETLIYTYPMPIDRMRPGNEKPRGIDFDAMLKEWYDLKEGEEKDFIVADKNGNPLEKQGLEQLKKGFVLLKIKSEPQHHIDQDLNIERTGTSYTAYEYVTDFADVELLEASWDSEYFVASGDKEHTYIPLRDFMRAYGKKKLIKPAPAAPKPPALEQSVEKKKPQFTDLPPQQRLARETNETARAYLATTAPYLQALQSAAKGDRIENPDLWRFVRTHEARFENLNIVQLLDTTEPGATFRDTKVARGVVITESKSTLRGKNLSGPVKDPDKTVKTLSIRFLQKTKAMGPDEIITKIGEEQAQDIAAVQYEISQLSEQDSAFARALRKHGFRQVRVEYISWRTRQGHGGAYRILVQFEGDIVPEKKE